MLGRTKILVLVFLCQLSTILSAQEKLELSQQSLASLEKVVADYVERDLVVGGELLVVHNDELIFHQVYGMADRESGRKWEIGAISNIRSMTKPLVGAAIQILIDRGQLSLDDRVAKYLDGFRNDSSEAITVRQILTHRSGLPLQILERIDQFPDLQHQANAVGLKGPQFKPDEKFWYSDIGTDVAAAVVERTSGKPLAEFLQEELFEPLKMHDTFVGTDSSDKRFERIASIYSGGPKAWTRLWSNQGKAFYPFAWGSQSVYSTPKDYAKFLSLWLNDGTYGDKRILSKEAVRRQTSPVSPMSILGSDDRFPTNFDELEVWYGQLATTHVSKTDTNRVRIIGHSGSDGTVAWAWPEHKLCILYFTQTRGGTTTLKIEEEIDRLIFGNRKTIAKTEVPSEIVPLLGSYVANFGMFENETLEVTYKDDKLALDIPSLVKFDLEFVEKTNRWVASIARDQVQIQFSPEENGKVNGFVLYQHGAELEVPRVGTSRAKELAKDREVTSEELSALVGTYDDPPSGGIVEVLAQKGQLYIKSGNQLVALRPSQKPNEWHVRQMPGISMVVNRDKNGAVLSITRYIGKQELVRKKIR